MSETFPGITIGSLKGGILLWDGDCGFCGAMVGLMNRMARQPFLAVPFQSVNGHLPPEVLRRSRDQMHWVCEDGSVVGGGRAFTKVLAASGYRTIATLLESALILPFVSLGYHMVARNRHWLSRLTPAQCSLRR